MKLSPRESQALSYIARKIQTDGRAPTQDMIAGHLNYEARSYVSRILKKLESKGLIRREMYKPRGIEIIKQELRAQA